MERKGRNASDEEGGGRAWIKRERELIEPRGNYELRWPRLIHFRFVAEISSACAYLSSSSSPAALVTVHDGRAPDTRVFHTPSFRHQASVSRRFLSVSLFVEPCPSRLPRETDRERRRKNYPGNTRVWRGTVPVTLRVLKGVEGRGKLREARIERVYIQWAGKER